MVRRTTHRPGRGPLGRNVIAGVVGQACGIPIALVTTPILVHGLGAAAYGLWHVAMAVGTWVGFVNMVLSTSAIRFVGYALGLGEVGRVHEAHQALRRWARVVAIVGATVLIGLTPWLVHHAINVPPPQRDLALGVLLAQAVVVLFQTLTAVEFGVIAAYQRLELLNAIRVSVVALQSGGAAVAVLLGHGLRAVVWWVASMQAVEWVAASWCARWLQPAAASSRRVDMKGWGVQLLRYGGPLLIGYLAAQLFLPASRTLLGILSPLEEVAYFAVPLTLAINVKALSTHVASAVLPAISERTGQADRDGLRQLYLRGLRWSWLAVVPPAGLVMALGGKFISAWIGADFGARVTPLIPTLVLGLNAYYFSSIPEVVAQGMGRPGAWVAIIIGSGLVNVVLGWWLVAHRGAQGAAETLLISGAILTVGLFVWAARVLQVGWRSYLETFDVRVLAVTAVVAGVLVCLGAGHALSLAAVIGWGVIGGLSILALAPWWLPSEERLWLQRQWQG